MRPTDPETLTGALVLAALVLSTEQRPWPLGLFLAGCVLWLCWRAGRWLFRREARGPFR